MNSGTLLITGGGGYIGSHTVVQLQAAGYRPLVLDNLSNCVPAVFERIEQISGQPVELIEGDVRDSVLLERIFSRYPIDAVIHFAGLKAVGESVQQPLRYYRHNVQGSLTLFEAMQRHGCKRLVFSSSATVYGPAATMPVNEQAPLAACNPYGRSKLMVEEMLGDLAAADSDWQIALLRYFNPVGAHPSGLIGEDPVGVPNNLLPYVAQVAIGRLPQLQVFGDDYPTPDGTGVRDYIHVMDLADGHLKALQALTDGHGCVPYNLGTGRGYSVLEVVAAFAAESGRPVPYDIAPRRAGDAAISYADPTFSRQQLGWRASRDLAEMVRDHWRWQQRNPNGYPTE
ncbi:UDP-glucose 4-epimerase GalE [Marinobacterium sp. CAU 1594]|nr:UDP-glucose 4-epimerase GalE [Marinobacterium arenosum]